MKTPPHDFFEAGEASSSHAPSRDRLILFGALVALIAGAWVMQAWGWDAVRGLWTGAPSVAVVVDIPDAPLPPASPLPPDAPLPPAAPLPAGRFTPDELMAFRVQGVTADYVERLARKGYTDLSAAQLLAMRIHGVTDEYIEALAQRGYDRLTADELIAFRVHGVSPEYVDAMNKALR